MLLSFLFFAIHPQHRKHVFWSPWPPCSSILHISLKSRFPGTEAGLGASHFFRSEFLILGFWTIVMEHCFDAPKHQVFRFGVLVLLLLWVSRQLEQLAAERLPSARLPVSFCIHPLPNRFQRRRVVNQCSRKHKPKEIKTQWLHKVNVSKSTPFHSVPRL